MRNRKFLGLLAIALVSLVTIASAQQFPPRRGTFTNVPQWVPGNSTTNIVSDPVPLFPHVGIAIWTKFYGTNSASTDPLIFRVEASPDGITWSTTGLFLTNSASGTNTVVGYHLLAPHVLDHAKEIRLQSIQNTHDATNAIRIESVSWSLSP